MSPPLHPPPIPPPLLDDVRRASQEAAPREACGLLLGRRRPLQLVALYPARNRAPAGRFLIDAGTLLAARDAAERAGLELLGPWHSHPSGRGGPSEADHAAARAWSGSTWLIVGREASLWRAASDGLHPLEAAPDRGGDVLQSAAHQGPAAPL